MPPFKKYLFILLVFIVGCCIFLPQLDFQFYLAQGDHGRDLYSFKKTFEGALPYKDYSSLNGPFMPYYYSLFYHLLGVSIQSTLIGYYLLIVLTGVVIFLTARLYIETFWAFSCALWYWAFRGLGFYYTYNHCGALFLMVLAIYCLLAYLQNPKKKFVITLLIALFLMLLIRPNIAFASILASIASLGLIISRQHIIQKGKKFFTICAGAIGILIIAFLIYRLLTKDLPQYIVSNDFDFYLRAVNVSRIPQNFFLLFNLVKSLIFSSGTSILISILLCASAVRALFFSKRLFTDKAAKDDYLLSLAVLAVFIFFTSLEYLVSFELFRIGWFLPLIILLIFFVVALGLKNTPKILRLFVCSVLLFVAVIASGQNYFLTLYNKRPETLLNLPPNRVYVAKQHEEWLQTIIPAVTFIQQHVPKDAKILSLPYAPLYYFLSGRDGGSRELFFLNMPEEKNVSVIKDIPKEKQLDIINEIKENEVALIIISNRAFRSADKMYGVFGKNYGGLLADYIFENFEEVATFGPWEKPAHWIINHAVKIYQRKI